MKNLAHDLNCDQEIKRELIRARIPIVKFTGQKAKSDVPFSIYGKLGDFEFHRYWYYWVATGPVPLNVAQELYKDPVGKTDIRVAGHCGCPPPEYPWVDYFDEKGRKLYKKKENDVNSDYNLSEEKKIEYLGADWRDRMDFVEDPAKELHTAIVNMYHIDSEVGLRVFVDSLFVILAL